MSSRDSDSFVHDDVSGRYAMFDRSQWWCYHPKVRENWRTVLAAVLLLIIGIGKFQFVTRFLVNIDCM